MRNAKTMAWVAVLALGLAAGAAAQADRQRRSEGPTVPKEQMQAQPNFAPQGCVAIPDAAYDGTIGSMACVPVSGIGATITDVDVTVGVDHTWVGDMVIKLQNPAATTTVTLTSRPGLAEPADDGGGCCGDSSNLASTSPLLFNDDGGGPSSETMGSTILTDGVICQDDGICEFTPNPGAATPGNLSAFDGQSGSGTWNLCIGDSAAGDTGDICSVAIVFNGLAADLAIAKTAPDGVAESGPFDYFLEVTNNGPADATNVVVADSLPAGLVYLSDDCGGSIAGQDFTWNVGTVTNGASAICTLTVELATPGCTTVTNTATVTSDVSDTDPSNNTSTASNAVEAVADGSFEDGTPNSFWAEASTNFGTPLCDDLTCNTAVGTGPHSGAWWVWFGGIAAFEEGSVTQSVTIPATATTLTFWLEIPTCGTAGAADWMEMTLDGVQLFYADATSAMCNTVGYVQQSIDVSAYADDGVHTLAFHSVTASGQITNFFVDDVSLTSTSCVAGGVFEYPLIQEIPTLGTIGFAAFAGLLALAGLALVRRRAA